MASERLSPVRICLTASAGGHFAELLRLRPAYVDLPHFYMLPRNAARAQDSSIGRVYWVPDYGRGGRWRRIVAIGVLAARSVGIYLRERPNVVLTTGAATGLLLALLVRATGGRVIYVECSAQVRTPSRSGRAFRWIAQPFFVQWPTLLRHYPRSEYGGLLL